MKGCAYIAMIVVAGFVTLVLIGMTVPEKTCGEIGYHAKLTGICRAALGTADSDHYCDDEDRRQLACAQATRDDDDRRFREDFYRKLHERS